MHLSQNWEIRKPSASSRGGVVAAQNGTAAQIGADVLAAGGTAVDAVVATAFALAALEPWSSGLGGIGHLVVHQAGADRAESVDFGPIAPSGLDPTAYPLSDTTRTELFTWSHGVVGDRLASEHDLDATALREEVDTVIAAADKTGGRVRHLDFLRRFH